MEQRATPVGRMRRTAVRFALFVGLLVLTAGLVGLPWIFPIAFPLAWVGMGMLALAASQLRPATAFCFGYAAGIGALAIAFHWSVVAIAETVGASEAVAGGVFGGLLLWEGLQMGLFALMVSWVVGRDLKRVWAVPVLWIVPEFWWPKIFPWSMAHLQTDYPLLLQTADWGGVASVSFLFMLAAVIAMLLLALLARRFGWMTTPVIAAGRHLGLAGGLFAGIVMIGAVRQQQVQNAADAGESFRVAAVQVDPAYGGAVERLRDLSNQVRSEADLICWPESSTGIYDETLTNFRDELQTVYHSLMPNPATVLIPDAKRHLLAGAKTYRPGHKDSGPYLNTAMLVAPDQSIVGRYVKRALMPIGEYMPGEQLFPELRSMAKISDTILPGTDAEPIQVAGVARPGVLICYEDLVTWTARSTVARGADCLVALINASAFTDPITLDQHYRLAMLRSVENRRALVRCSATGVTGIVSPTGELVASLPCLTEGVLVQSVPRMQGRTVYNRFGDWFAYLATAVALGLLIDARGRQWKRRKR